MEATENKKLVTDALSGVGVNFLHILAEDIRWTLIGSTKYSGTYVGKNEASHWANNSRQVSNRIYSA